MARRKAKGQSSGPGSGVQTVTGLNTDNTDPLNPVVNISVDGVSIVGDGTPGNPLVALGSGGVSVDANFAGAPYAPTNGQDTWYRSDTTGGDFDINTAPSPTNGQLTTISNEVGVKTVTFVPLNYKIAPGQTAIFKYDLNTTSWVLMTHLDCILTTLTNFLTQQTAGELADGFYMITNPAQASRIIVRAKFGNSIATDALGYFANGDYQNIGDYSGIPTQSGIGTNLGVWSAAYIPAVGDLVSSPLNFKWYTNISGVNGVPDPSLDPTNWVPTQAGEWDSGGTYAQNQVVIYGTGFGGTMWVNITGVNGGAPDVTPADWLALPSTASGTGYIFEWDHITYNVTQDAIVARYDQRGNEYVGTDWYLFQWGNNNVVGITVKGNSTLNCLHNKGAISACTFADGVDVNLNLNTLVSWSGCEISNYFTSIVADATLSFSGKVLNGGMSTFNIDLVASTNYALGVLTIPAPLHWYGIINLTDAAGGFISNLVNGSTVFPFRFTCTNGISNTISPLAIAGAVAGDIVSDGGNVILTGRTNGSDFYELIASGNVYMKNNVTALL